MLLFPGLASLRLPVCALTVAAVTALGVWAAGRSEPFFGRCDDGRIVIDEVAGQWIALLPLAPFFSGDGTRTSGALLLGVLVVTGFVAFRCFDIWKPGPVGWAERRYRGGVGVMADDVMAGVLAAGVLLAAMLVAPWIAAGGAAA